MENEGLFFLSFVLIIKKNLKSEILKLNVFFIKSENEAANDLNPNLIENINVNLNYNRDGQVAINIEATNEHSNEELAAEEIMVPPYMVPQQLIEIGQPVDINAEVSVVMDAPTENNANQTDYNLDLSDAQSSPSHKKRKR